MCDRKYGRSARYVAHEADVKEGEVARLECAGSGYVDFRRT